MTTAPNLTEMWWEFCGERTPPVVSGPATPRAFPLGVTSGSSGHP